MLPHAPAYAAPVVALLGLSLVVAAPATPPPTPSRAAMVARIDQIQGAGHRSPLLGQPIRGTRGVVTATTTRGFWIQAGEPGDTNPATSEGLFVSTPTPTARVRDLVEVAGTVTEHRSSPTSLTTTQLTTTTVSLIASNQPLPAPTVIGRGGRIPPRQVLNADPPGDVEDTGQFLPDRDGIDFYESLEGMLVQINNPVAVSPASPGGHLTVLADDGADATVRSARGGIVVRSLDDNPERLTLSAAITPGAVPTDTTVADHFTPHALGVLDYTFGSYQVLLTRALTRIPGNLRKQTTTPARPHELAIATFNVENLSATSPRAKFDGLADIITTNLQAPGILIIEEIQDNDGPQASTVVAADHTWRTLINAIQSRNGPLYDYRQIDPLSNNDGGTPGGNIRIGFLYRTDIGLQFVDRPGGNATTPTHIAGTGSNTHLTLSPGRIDPTNPAFTNTRKSLVGEFRFHNTTLFLIGNHWTAQRGDDPTFGRYQPPRRPSRTQRTQQARSIATFVTTLLTANPAALLIVAGDLNDTEFSPPAQTLTNTGLTNLSTTLPLPHRYTYIYQGNGQTIDHTLISPKLTNHPHTYDIIHLNTEFPDQTSDHDPQIIRLPLN